MNQLATSVDEAQHLRNTIKMIYDPPLDAGIAPYVDTLCAAGIETCESCEGGQGHAYAEPTVRFLGDRAEGLKALAIAQQNDLPVADLRRVWPVIDGEPTGPYWELTFYRLAVSASGG